MSVLIISSAYDLHARAVAWGLNNAGVRADIVDVTTFPSNNCLSFSPLAPQNNSMHFVASNQNNEIIDLKEVKAVWCRRLLSNPQYFDFSEVHEDDLNGSAYEVRAFIDNLWSVAYDAFGTNVSWINPPISANQAKNKALQLRTAHSVGFQIPDTILGNHPNDIRAFCSKHGGEIIMKPFYPRQWKVNANEFHQATYLINEKHLQDSKAIQLCPGIYQNKIEKAFELRVLVIGKKIIAAKLYSQDQHHSKVDWRLDAYKKTMRIEPYILENKLEEKIFLFMERMNLKCGSIDLIVTPRNEIVFLEINEQGQFLFLEIQNPEIKTLSTVCDYLAREAGIHPTKNYPDFSEYTDSVDELKQKEELNNIHNNPEIKYTFN